MSPRCHRTKALISKTESSTLDQMCTTMTVMAAGQTHELPLVISCSRGGRWKSHIFFKIWKYVLFFPISFWNSGCFYLPLGFLPQLIKWKNPNLWTSPFTAHVRSHQALTGRKRFIFRGWKLGWFIGADVIYPFYSHCLSLSLCYTLAYS